MFGWLKKESDEAGPKLAHSTWKTRVNYPITRENTSLLFGFISCFNKLFVL